MCLWFVQVGIGEHDVTKFLHMDPGKESPTPLQTPQQNHLNHDEIDGDSLTAQQPGSKLPTRTLLFRCFIGSWQHKRETVKLKSPEGVLVGFLVSNRQAKMAVQLPTCAANM